MFYVREAAGFDMFCFIASGDTDHMCQKYCGRCLYGYPKNVRSCPGCFKTGEFTNVIMSQCNHVAMDQCENEFMPVHVQRAV